MPAVLAQATLLTVFYCLAIWTGCVFLVSSILPRLCAAAKDAAGAPPAKILVAGIPAPLTLLVFSLLFRTGNHNLKVAGMVLVLIGFAVAVVGTAGAAARLGEWLGRRGRVASPGSGTLPFILAAALLAIPIAIPRLGLLVALPVLLTICGGIGAMSVTKFKTAAPAAGARGLLLCLGIVLVFCAVPVWRTFRVERDTLAVGMADGAHLAADVYIPAGKPPYPLVLIQTPNGRRDAGPDTATGVRARLRRGRGGYPRKVCLAGQQSALRAPNLRKTK